MKKKSRVDLRISEGDKAKLKLMAIAQDSNISEIVRQIIKPTLDKKK